jgi:ribosome modulation factor
MCEAIKAGRRAYEDGFYRGNNPYLRGTHAFVMWLRGWREAETEELWRQKND